MKEIKREKHIIDATEKAVGRIATEVAMILRGKNKPSFEPRVDAGDFVEIINADKVKFTGKKFAQKDYYKHSLYPGGLKRTPLAKIFKKDPTELIKRAVNGMLPKNKLREGMMKRLSFKA